MLTNFNELYVGMMPRMVSPMGMHPPQSPTSPKMTLAPAVGLMPVGIASMPQQPTLPQNFGLGPRMPMQPFTPSSTSLNS